MATFKELSEEINVDFNDLFRGDEDIYENVRPTAVFLPKSEIDFKSILHTSFDSEPNATSICQVDYVPSIQEYYQVINTGGIIVFTFGAFLVIATLIVYGQTLRHVLGNLPPSLKGQTAFVISVYPVVSVVTYCSVVVPRAHLLAEAVSKFMFMGCMYQLYCLMLNYAGGESEIIRRMKPNNFNTRVAPCCCWPCCCCLPKSIELNKSNIRIFRILVLQLPVVQGLIYLALLVMWAEEESLSRVNYMYSQPLVIASILLGIWAMSMALRLLSEELRAYRMQEKFMVLQMVLLLAKLQGLITKMLVWFDALPCGPIISPTVYSFLIYNALILVEMFLLSLIASRLYLKELPESSCEVPSSAPSHVCIIGDIYRNENNNITVINPKDLEDKSIV